MKKHLVLICLSVFFLLTSCSKDKIDEPLIPIAGTTWLSKIRPEEISAPAEYREKGYWILRFTSYETFSIGIQDENKTIISYEAAGRYIRVNNTHIKCIGNSWNYSFTIDFDTNRILSSNRIYTMQ